MIRLSSFGITLLLLGSGSALAEAGRFQFVHGEVSIIRADGRQAAASKGDVVDEGDTVATGALAQAQLQMKDEGIIALRPDSRLRIDTYRFAGKTDGSEQGIFALLRGGFRSITGLIGRVNKDAYKVRTPTATIGIRGTDHEPLYIPPPVAGETPLGPPGTYDKVNSGQTYLESSGGRVDIGVNQVGFVPATGNVPPVTLPAMPSFLRGTPGLPASGQRSAAPASSGQSTAGTTRTASETGSTGSTASDDNRSTTGSVIGAPSTTLVTPVTANGFNLTNPTADGTTIAPAGTAVAGGGMGGNGHLNNGAGYIGDPTSNLVITLDASGAPLSVTGDKFSYIRYGAPAPQRDSTTLGGETVNWGIYNGGSMVDDGVASSKAIFFWMASTSASTPASLAAAMPNANASLTFANVAGFTKPISEDGRSGGTVRSNTIILTNLGGVPSVSSYSLSVTDAQNRYWSTYLAGGPLSLTAFRTGSTQNLYGSCTGCTGTNATVAGNMSAGVTGNVQGVVIGNPVAGVISSYSLKAGGASVVGAVVSH